MKINAMELWDDLELKLINLSREIEYTDAILSDKITCLVNHFNGNMAHSTQYVCIDRIDAIINNLSRKDYFIDRKYTKEETNKIEVILNDLVLFQKVLKSEYKEYLNNKAVKEPTNVDRLPNINNEKAMDLFKSIDK